MQPINYGKKTTRGKLSPTVLSYFAGFFDGEGSISIAKVLNKRNNSWNYILSVQCSQTVKEPILLLQQIFGGSVQERNRDPKYKTNWHWQIRGQIALNFLRTMQPYLWLKRNKAQIGIAFQESKKYSKLGKKLEYQIIQERENYRRLIVQPQRLSGKTTI